MDMLFIKMIEVSVNIFESVITVEFVTKMNETKYHGRKRHIAAGLIFLLLTINAEIFNYITYFSEAMTYVGLVIIFLYSLTFLKGKISHRLFSCVIIMFVIAVSNFLTTLAFSLIFNISVEKLMSEFSIYRFVCLLVSKIILFVATRILLNMKIKGIASIPATTVISVIIVPTLTIIVMVIITEVSVNLVPNDRNTFYLLLSLLGMVIINIVFYILLAKLDKEYNLETENRLLKQKNILQLEYVKNTHALNEEIRAIRHDMKNHIIYLKEFFSKGCYEEGLSYANRMVDKIDSTQKLIYTDRVAFDAVVNAKLNEAADKGISVGYNIMCYLDNSMEDDDMVSLMGNILDNAIEASERLQDRKEIFLEVKKARSYLLIIVKNAISEPVLKNNPGLKSTKEDEVNHGLGVKNVRRIVEKYNGLVTYDEKNDEFTCKIMLLV